MWPCYFPSSLFQQWCFDVCFGLGVGLQKKCQKTKKKAKSLRISPGEELFSSTLQEGDASSAKMLSFYFPLTRTLFYPSKSSKAAILSRPPLDVPSSPGLRSLWIWLAPTYVLGWGLSLLVCGPRGPHCFPKKWVLKLILFCYKILLRSCPPERLFAFNLLHLACRLVTMCWRTCCPRG